MIQARQARERLAWGLIAQVEVRHMDQPNPASKPALEIVGCDIELVDGGGYLITHRGSGDTAVAATPEEAEVEGIALRVVDSWRQPPYSPDRFRTGDPTWP